ncbi:hypothetical protein NC653_005556 [Populus alba x Populus x berolinensis]|uniref:Uncharacterized protein n=1 Tax=Populus alba x Populus x berolinensis TaxID=444605 RepID=A0AAD6WB40_9ROSI|nr:hypothetical protein NC653_005556 [Populus alba x Populus x berolinensis]
MAPVMIASNAMLHLGIPGANSTTKEKRFRQEKGQRGTRWNTVSGVNLHQSRPDQ